MSFVAKNVKTQYYWDTIPYEHAKADAITYFMTIQSIRKINDGQKKTTAIVK